MSMYRCPACGELFSTSYKKCPFCEEDELMSGRSAPKNKKGRRSSGKEPSVLGPALVIVLLLVTILLVFLFKGGDILNALKRGEDNKPPIGDVVDDAGEEGEGEGESSAEPLSLGSAALELDYAASMKLEVSGGSGSYSWSSDDSTVASVSSDGTVKGLKAGTAVITVSDGESSCTCTVTVKAEAVELTIGKTDVTIGTGDSFRLGAEGGTITYRSEDPDIAVVGADGVVTGKSYGKTTVYASNGSMELGCIVRVK